MDLIEKAVKKSERSSKASLIERAAKKLGTGPAPDDGVSEPESAEAVAAPPAPDVAEPAAPQPGPPPPAAGPAPTAPPAPDRHGPASRRVDIDLDRLFTSGMVTPRGERTRIAEEYRVIKRPLLLKAVAGSQEAVDKGNLIMVSSSIPGEGKTFTAVNLAMSMAKERDVYVLLVDADLSRPAVFPTLGIEADMGFSDLLEDASLDVADVLLRTNVENLSLIAAGRPHPMGTELLASERAGHVIGEIAHRYANRVIILDTAPVLASSEGGALSRFVGQVVFVVEAEKTNEAAVKGALDVLGSCKHIGLVLNKARTRLASGLYGGYYTAYYDESYYANRRR